MKKIIGLKEFRNNLDVVIKHIHQGHTFIVFKRNKPVFEVGPVSRKDWIEILDLKKPKKD